MTTDKATTEPSFAIQRIYLKDCSFETPNSPDVFRKDWQPNVEFELQVLQQKLAEDVYEVIVSGTATAKLDDKIAFLAEVKQAGIFAMQNIPGDQLPILLNVVCPNILFPYFREVISSLTNKGSFPALTLEPINFEALYQQRLLQESSSGSGSATVQ